MERAGRPLDLGGQGLTPAGTEQRVKKKSETSGEETLCPWQEKPEGEDS